MRIYLDENLPPLAAQPLAAVYLDHELSTWENEELRGTDDILLLSTLRGRGFDAIVTRDRNQMSNPDERRAVAASGLRWIGVKDNKLKGLEQIAITVATLVAGMRFVFDHQPEGPTSYWLWTVPHLASQRIRIRAIDPKTA